MSVDDSDGFFGLVFRTLSPRPYYLQSGAIPKMGGLDNYVCYARVDDYALGNDGVELTAYGLVPSLVATLSPALFCASVGSMLKILIST